MSKEEEVVINPNAKVMCGMCKYEVCERTLLDQIYCKLNQIAWTLERMRRKEEEMNGVK